VSAWQVTGAGCRWLIATQGGRPLRIDCQDGARSATYTFGSVRVPGAITAPTALATRMRSGPTEVAAQIGDETGRRDEAGAGRASGRRLPRGHEHRRAAVAVDPEIEATVSRGFAFRNRAQDALTPALAPVSVAPGQSTQGWVAFLVPTSVGALTLRVGVPSDAALFSDLARHVAAAQPARS
jgi:hypothetical protein